MAELSTWLLILLLTSQGAVHADDAGHSPANSSTMPVSPTSTVSSDDSSQPASASSTVDTTTISVGNTEIPVVSSSQSQQDNAVSTFISVASSTDGSPTVTSPNQQIFTTDALASSDSSVEESSTLVSTISLSPAITTSNITHSNGSLTTPTQENTFTSSSTNSPLEFNQDSSSSGLPNYSATTQEQHADETTNTIMLSSAKASATTTFLESTSHVSAEPSSIIPDMYSASDQTTVSFPLHRSTSDIKTSVSSSDTTVFNRDAACTQLYQSLLHKYHVTKTTLIAVSVGSGLLILFLLVTIAVLCCTRRTCKQAKAQSFQAESTLHGGSQLYSWHPSLPRPSIRPSVYREVSVEMRENLQRRQRPPNEQSQTAEAVNRGRIQAIDGQVNKGFTSDANVDVPKQPAVAQAGGHKSPPVTFGPVSVVTISSTTPRVSQPTTSSSPTATSLPSETRAVTMPRMSMATTSSAPSETQPFQNASAQLDAVNGDTGRGQPHKKRRDLVYF